MKILHLFLIAIYLVLQGNCQQTNEPLTPEQKKIVENSQAILNGMYEANKLPHPSTVIDCIDMPTLQKIYDFINPIQFSKLSQGAQFVTNLLKTNPCGQSNPEVLEFLKVYGIDGGQSLQGIPISAIRNVVPLMNEVTKLNNIFQSGDYFAYGVEAATFLHELSGH